MGNSFRAAMQPQPQATISVRSRSRSDRADSPCELDTVGSPARKTGYQGSSREETIANRMRVDERHYPTESNASVANKTDLSRPMASVTATPGRFSTKGTTLDPKRNDHINTIMRASGSPSVNRPTAGQMVAAKIITPQ